MNNNKFLLKMETYDPERKEADSTKVLKLSFSKDHPDPKIFHRDKDRIW